MALPDRWEELIPAAEQMRLVASPARFKVVAAGRRSGKTERAKRHLVLSCMDPYRTDATYAACAPTRDQAKRIWWRDLKALSPIQWVTDVSESELTLTFITGARLIVFGLDKPQRLEGIAIDGAVLDEFAECKPEAWVQSLRPALSTKGRPGWCWFTGRPRGRNHFYDLWTKAKTLDDWDAFHWPSSDILAPEEIESARRDLDPLTFQQEYEASFVSFDGLAYYQFNHADHLRPIDYQPNKPLVFCFDFNVDPGVCVIVQEQDLGTMQTTCVIGEVHIPRNSNTPAVCARLMKDWAHHKGEVHVYGDATGGARKSSQTEGADWDLVRAYLKGFDLRWRVPRSNPPERDRLNAMNTRLKSAAGIVRMAIDPSKAPHAVKDFEGVTLLQGGSGELDKKANPELTHLTDALGYYVHARHPIGGAQMRVS